MSATILDGTATLAAIKAELAERVAALAGRGVVPGLGTVLVGDDPASPGTSTPSTRTAPRSASPASAATCPRPRRRPRSRPSSPSSTPTRPAPAFLVQQPTGLGGATSSPSCPRSIRSRTSTGCTRRTSAGWCSASRRRCRARPPASSSCCAATTCRSPARTSSSIGRGITVGRPLALMLTRRSENATVTVCHTGTRDLAAQVRRGRHRGRRRRLAAPDHRRHGEAGRGRPRRRRQPGRRQDRRRRRPDVAEVAGYLSPNPGGVGPMTRAMLLRNVVEAAEAARSPARPGLTCSAGPCAGSGSRWRSWPCWPCWPARFGYLLVAPAHWRRGTGLIAAAMLLAGGAPGGAAHGAGGPARGAARGLDAVRYLLLGGVILGVDIRLHG